MHTLPQELVEGLTHCNPEEVLAWIELKSGLRGKWGQTYVVLTRERFFAMTRKSFSDPWEVVPLDPEGENTITLSRYEESLILRGFDGTSYGIQVYDLERPNVVAFLEVVLANAATLQRPPAPNVDDSPPPQPVVQQAPPRTNPPPERLTHEVEQALDECQELPEDPTTAFVMDSLERLLHKGNEYLQFGTENDPLERLGAFLEDFFIKQGERAFNEGAAERAALFERLTSLKGRVAARLSPDKGGSPLSPGEEHDLATHVRTGDLLAKRSATLEKALQSYELALELDPHRYEVLLKAGQTALELGHTTRARELYEAALEQAPDTIAREELQARLSTITTLS